MAQSLPSYLLHPTHYCPHCVLLALILAASYLLSYLLSLTSSHTHCILLAIVHAAGVHIAIPLVVIVLIASCRICQLSLVSNTQSNATCVKTVLLHVMIAAMDVTLGACAKNAKCSSSICRCTLDIENRTGLSHYACNPLRVCEYDASICCDVTCLESQRNHGAITRVVRMPFALTQLRPEGKCPATLRPVSRCRGELCPDAWRHGKLRPNSHCVEWFWQ